MMTWKEYEHKTGIKRNGEAPPVDDDPEPRPRWSAAWYRWKQRQTDKIYVKD